MRIIECDLLDAPTQYIAHQCNCCSRGAAGIAKQIFERFPDAAYPRQRVRDPGTISVHSNRVINCYAQLVPGKPCKNDTAEMRLRWFRQCLFAITKIEGIRSVALPFGIGCGLAGGNWNREYIPLLTRFDIYCQSKGIEVIMCRRPKHRLGPLC